MVGARIKMSHQCYTCQYT